MSRRHRMLAEFLDALRRGELRPDDLTALRVAGGSPGLGDNLPDLLPTPTGSVYYVDPIGGSDTTGNGTTGSPWLTLQKAIDSGFSSSPSNKTIRLRTGNLGTAGTTVHTISGKVGTPTQPWRIEPDSGHSPVIRGTLKIMSSHYGQLWNLKVRGAAAGDVTEALATIRTSSTNIQIVGCEFYESGSHNAALYVGGGANNNVLVLRCHVHDNGDIGVDDNRNNHQGVYWQDGHGHIIDTLLTYNVSYGIQLYNTAGIDLTVTGCVSSRNYRGYLINVVAGDPSTAILRNCIAYDNDDSGFEQAFARPTTFEVHDAVSNSNGGGTTAEQYRWADTAPTSSNLRTGNPNFVDAAADDFRISAGSDAIGQGTAEWAWPTDRDGANRAEPPDIGAYEFGSPGPTPQARRVRVHRRQPA